MSELKSSLSARILEVRAQICAAASTSGRNAGDIRLMAVSKTQTTETVVCAAELDVDVLGENRVQELAEKSRENAYGEKNVHLIGHLQSNKVKNAVLYADVIESVDSIEIAREIAKEAAKIGKIQNVLIEIKSGGEDSKFGILPSELCGLMEQISALSAICVRGVMTIPPISQKNGQNRPYFESLYELFIDIRQKKYDNSKIDTLSMGMSRDFCDAIAAGSTQVRIGTGIFGSRNY